MVKKVKPNDEIRKEIMIQLADLLKDLSFKKQGNTFFRETEEGLYQIIELTLGPAWGLMKDHIGLSFGVATEEWIEHLNQWKRPKNLTTSDCEIKDIYTTIVNKDADCWFKISKGLPWLVSTITKRINHFIVPFLDNLKTRLEIINLWEKDDKKVGLPPRHKLSIGVLMYLSGDKQKGRDILEIEYKNNQNNDFYIGTIEKVLNE